MTTGSDHSMGQFLHQWRQYREKLNHTLLAHETREY
jgi:hypothetical protein